jgi:acetyltransferase-like isoleucine patch superfamily enzyme
MRIVGWACGLFVLVDRSWYRFRKLVARTYYRTRLEACGENCRFDPLSSHIRYEAVKLGDNVFIGPGAVIGRAVIGNDVMFGPRVHIRNGNHSFGVVGTTIREANDPGDDHGPIMIGDDVWVGEESTILHRGAIGEGSVIGTRSLVDRPIPPYVVAGGQPCRILKRRFSDEDLRRHLTLRGRADAEIEQTIAARNHGLEAFEYRE